MAYKTSFLLLAAALFVPSTVMADAVPAAPESCPPGLNAVTDHEGPRCEPKRCMKDPECGEGASCVELARCRETKQVPVRPIGELAPREFDRGLCDAEGNCPDKQKCAKWRQCEPTEPHANWDPKTRTWVRAAREVPKPEPKPEENKPPEEKKAPEPATAAPATKGSETNKGTGCSVTTGRSGLLAFFVAWIVGRRFNGRRS